MRSAVPEGPPSYKCAFGIGVVDQPSDPSLARSASASDICLRPACADLQSAFSHTPGGFHSYFKERASGSVLSALDHPFFASVFGVINCIENLSSFAIIKFSLRARKWNERAKFETAKIPIATNTRGRALRDFAQRLRYPIVCKHKGAKLVCQQSLTKFRIDAIYSGELRFKNFDDAQRSLGDPKSFWLSF